MKPLLLLAALELASCFISTQPQSLSLPILAPVACSAQTGCFFLTRPNTTVMVIARFSGNGAITDDRGSKWTRDQCVTFTGDCIFHANYGAFCGPGGSCTAGVTLSFSGDQFQHVLILVYDGTWNLDAGNFGTYANQNSVFPDCVNGQDCPYAWTLPIETEAGALIIAWGDGTPGFVRPGPGFTLEGNASGVFAEDMIAPTTGVYIGSWMPRCTDGTEQCSGHWLAGVAAYKRQ
jgi:hypothetical protein